MSGKQIRREVKKKRRKRSRFSAPWGAMRAQASSSGIQVPRQRNPSSARASDGPFVRAEVLHLHKYVIFIAALFSLF